MGGSIWILWINSFAIDVHDLNRLIFAFDRKKSFPLHKSLISCLAKTTIKLKTIMLNYLDFCDKKFR